MFDWKKAVADSLVELGGREVCVSGARLHQQVSKLGQDAGEQFGEFLKQADLSFSNFIEAELPDVSVHKRGSTDMLVGYPDATVPVTTRRSRTGRNKTLRQDVYLAFTRISPKPHFYIPSDDLFASDAGEADQTIAVPSTTLEELIGWRKEFTNSLGREDAKTQLFHTLDYSTNQLAGFSLALAQLGLRGEWHDFNYVVISDKIRAWASMAKVEVLKEWFEPGMAEFATRDSPQQVLSVLAPFLTDAEIRELRIPFRAVEAMYYALSRRHDTDLG